MRHLDDAGDHSASRRVGWEVVVGRPLVDRKPVVDSDSKVIIGGMVEAVMRGASIGAIVLLVGALVSCAQRDESASPGATEAPRQNRFHYEKPEGVVFHIPAILGMRYSSFTGSEVETYLGTRMDEHKLPGIRGTKYRYGQGEIYVKDDLIYAVAYDFAEPVSALKAMHLTGLPESLLAEFKAYSMGKRIERSAYGGMRRIILHRVRPGVELFDRIEAWKFLPTERH